MTDDPTRRHPDLEHYYDAATDRIGLDAHLEACTQCRGWLADIHERLGDLPCIEIVELVTGYLDASLDGSLDAALRARVEDHLRLCEGCRNYVDEMRITIATIGTAGRMGGKPPEPSEPVMAGLIAAFRAWCADAPGGLRTDRR